MPDETTTGAESGGATGGSTAPASTGSEQTAAIDTAAAGQDSTEGTAPADTDVQTDDVDEDAVAAEDLAKIETPEGEAAKVEKPEGETEADAQTPKSKAVTAQREHITNLERQLATHQATEEKLLEIGGMPTIELARPLIDAALNPEAKASDVLSALAQVAPHHSPEQLAWSLIDENKETVVADFFGEGITSDILTQLVDGYKAGDFKFDDDVFGLDDKAKGKDAGAKTAEDQARYAELTTQRTAVAQTVAKTYEDSVNVVLAPFADAEGDTDEIKGLKAFVRDGVNAQIAVMMSSHAGFQRVQKLLQMNSFKPAETMANGSVAIAIRKMAEQLVTKANPFVAATIGQAQKQAKKIKEVREEPSGASTQADVIPQRKEITSKTPNWRQELDAQLKADLDALQAKAGQQPRGPGGKFI